jgi:glutamate-5-semialdehyde dehydrogenase
MSDKFDIAAAARAARKAGITAARLNTADKNAVLLRIADALEANADSIIEKNAIDLENGKEKGLSAAMIDRLALSKERIAGMASAVREVAALDDPIGEVTGTRRRPNGLVIEQRRIPLGVIGIIYESRPNVTSDAASLCLKAGNAVILRGGSEAINSNRAVGAVIARALADAGLPPALITVVPDPDRGLMTEMLKLADDIDLIIPRGGEGLIRFVVENSRIPVIKHYKGVCHAYIDKSADHQMAENIVVNGKTQRPGVCNALETMLIHVDEAEIFLPRIAKKLKEKGVTLRGCPRSRNLVGDIEEATEEDWPAEYLDLIIAVKIVDSIEDAIDHIEQYSSDHTETIITSDYLRSRKFLADIDSSTVMVNASTRFSDGGEFGLGAEIGISTTRLHAYGPMGLEALTTQKFVVYGEGQIR